MMAKVRRDLNEQFQLRARQFVEKCTGCGDCLRACPVFPLMKVADSKPEVVITKLTDLLETGKVSDEAYEMAFSCPGPCGSCAKACPEGLVLYSVFMPAFAKLAQGGKKAPSLSYQYLPKHRFNFASVFSALQIEPSQERWLREAPPVEPTPVDVVFFGGCHATAMPHILLDIISILDQMNLDYVALAGGDLCCGVGAMLSGDLDEAQSLGQTLISTIASFRPSKAVFYCAGCHMLCLGTWSQCYTVPFQSYELIQFLAENLDSMTFTKNLNKTITLHDSCCVDIMKTSDAARKLLQAIPGLNLVEMEHNRADALCCGGYANAMRPEIMEPIRRASLEEAEEIGADVLATVCPGCQESFAPLEGQYQFEVRNYTSLLAEAMGFHHEDRFKGKVAHGDASRVLAESRDCIRASDYSQEEIENILPDYFRRFCLKHGS